MKNFIFILVFLCHSFNIYTQSLKGTIKDLDNLPVAFTTIYISQLKSGTSSNAEGKYEIKLPEGEYDIEFRALGYQPYKQHVVVTKEPVILDIQLKEQLYSIADVVIKKGNEDPAYAIMRKAISLAPFYANQVKHYKSEVYIKGSMHMIKIPKLLANMAAKDGFLVKTGDVFVDESYNEITFDAPQKYYQRVVSSRSNFPGSDKPMPMEMVKTSMYQPNFYGAISPLSPNAFSYYKFKYEGVSFENGNSILKIKVIPKNQGPQIFSGYLYLLDKTFNIYSLDFIIEVNYGSCQLKQQFVKIKDNSWLPASHSFDYKLKGFGAKAEMIYMAAVKYKEVENNTEQIVPLWLKDEYANQKAIPEAKANSKELASIEEIMKKDKLSTRDMVKLARMMKKANDADSVQQRSLEVKNTTVFKIDSNARDKSPAYWSEIRPIPLMPEELKFVQKHDSLLLLIKKDTTKRDSVKRLYKPRLITPDRIALGHKWYNSYPNIYTFSGIVNPENLWFNPVDGFGYSMNGSIQKQIDSAYFIKSSAEIGYSFARKKVYWNGSLGLLYAPNSRGDVQIEAGQWATDFSGKLRVNRHVNSLACLFFHKNYTTVYDNTFVNITNAIDLANGLELKTILGFERRSDIMNNTNFSFFGRKEKVYSPNIPDNKEYSSFYDYYNCLYTDLKLEYVILNRYRMEHGRKQNLGSIYPIIELRLRKGINNILGSSANFTDVSMTLKQWYSWGRRSSFTYKVTAGTFLNRNNIHFADFYHPKALQAPFSFYNIFENFAMLPYYEGSTNSGYLDAHACYASQYILLKYLPLLNKTQWEERIQVAALNEKNGINFYEVGYGLGKLIINSSVYFFVSFDDTKYRNYGFKLVVPLYSNFW